MENMQEVSQSVAHTVDSNHVEVPSTPERETHRTHHGFPHHGMGHHPVSATSHGSCMSSNGTCASISTACSHHLSHANAATNTELLHVVRKQEMSWDHPEAAAVHKLERRLRVLERSDSWNKASLHLVQDSANSLTQLQQFPCDLQAGSTPKTVPPYSCIYVSPVYDDRRGSVMYRTHIVEDGVYGPRNRPHIERTRDDERDMEIKKLKLEIQRQDLEMRRLKTDLHKLRSLEFDDDRNVISDKFIDKVNTVRASTPTISRPHSYHDSLQHVMAEVNTSVSTSEVLVESSKEPVYGLLIDGQGPCGSHSGTPRRSKLSSHGSFKLLRENVLVGRRKNAMAPSAVPDLDGCTVLPDSTNSSSVARQMVSSLLSTMQTSLENLCNNIKMREPRESDSSKIDSGAMEDELFILKKSLGRLEDICHESGYESFTCEIRNNHMEADRDSVDGMLQQLAQLEFKVMALESSCVEKERRIEDLETQTQAVIKEREALLAEKYELSNVILEMQQDAEEQRHRIKELLSINEELLEISQAEEVKLESFQETRDKLMQQVVQYEDSCANLESLLLAKEKELEDLNRRLKAGQLGADSIIFEKFELLSKIQAMQVEADQQKTRIDELVSINEELLEFAQSKEDQIAYLNKEVDQLQAERAEKSRMDVTMEASQEENKGEV